MRFYKIVTDGYIRVYGIGLGGTEITEEEYNAIKAARKPDDNTHGYRLRDDLTWEQYELPVIDPLEKDLDDATALEMITGGG